MCNGAHTSNSISIGLIQQKIAYVKIPVGFPAGREVVSAVVLDYRATDAEKLEWFAGIPEEERCLAEALLPDTPPVNIAADHLNATLPEVARQGHSLQ